MTRPFLDTNLLVYAALQDKSDGGSERIEKAQTLLTNGGIVSVQVLNEFIDLARRKFKQDWRQVRNLLRAIELSCGSALPLTAEAQRLAVELAVGHKFRIYDAMIVATALDAGCDVLYSEDFQHGRKIEGMRVENPFRRP
ncbi:MAG: PIN domain-containing protein [Acidobacteriota bacterium]|nr:PIN domain-containing protein [Acidobacteriota bacterium]